MTPLPRNNAALSTKHRAELVSRPLDYRDGWPGPGGSEVRRPFGARGMSSVRYGIRLGDLKENWFLLFSNLTLNTRGVQAVAGLG